MSKENVKAFLDKLATDKELQAKLNDRARAAEAVIIPVAKEAGFDFTVDELKAYEAENAAKLSKDELNAVAGGFRERPGDRLGCVFQWGEHEPCPLGLIFG